MLWEEIKKPRRFLAINTDNNCRAHCMHCPYGENDKVFSLIGEVLKFVRLFKKNGGELIVLAARQPMASPAYEMVSLPIIDACRGFDLRVGINMSAYQIKDGIKKLQKIGGVSSISVSIDGIGGVHDRIRGIREEQWFSLIPELYEVTENVSISVTAMKQNLLILSEIVKSAFQLTGRVFVATVATTGKSDPRCHLSNKEFTAIDRQIAELGFNDRLTLEIPPKSLDIINLIASRYIRKFYFRDRLPYIETETGNEWRILDGICQFLSGFIRIMSNGDIRASYDLETPPIGNLSEQTEIIYQRLQKGNWFKDNVSIADMDIYRKLALLPWK